MKAIERLNRFIDYKGVKPAVFEREVGLSNGYIGKQLKRNADLGEGILIKILENCPEINPEWLLTGKGEMLKEAADNYNKELPAPDLLNEPRDSFLIKYVRSLETNLELMRQEIERLKKQ
ncbi:MAG: hypothetical protein H7Y10_04615 [Flavobacterium sp.]|nr:hypothetical protein [Flavobacterium sp.]